ncbi:MAG: NADP-dependent methylenetetrahydromethanopterin/methylenetetrahydrofolate dehydrogenase [Xanthobacteraceae bacterium]
MKRLLLLLDSDPMPNAYDIIVGYDGGADHIVSYGGITPDNVGPLIDGAVFTRGPSEKKHTAIFIGGANMAAGEELLAAVTKRFFGDFRVSVMLDSNGSNTTAAAGVAQIAKAVPLAGKKVVVLAGTGPVGLRAAALFAKEGAQVSLTSRDKQRAAAACRLIQARFGVSPIPVRAIDNDARGATIRGADIVFAAGAIGVGLLEERHWRDEWTIEIIADCNAQPPLGVGGIDATDKGNTRQQKVAFGALGIGGLKLKLHRACVAQLFQSSDQVWDAEEIYALAKTMT